MAIKIWEVITRGTLFGQQILNRYHFLNADGAGDPLVLLDDFKTHVLQIMQPQLSNGFVWTDMSYQQVYPTLALQQGYAVGFPITGASGSTSLASSMAASVKFNVGASVALAGFTGTKYIKRAGKRFAGYPDNTAGNAFNSAGARLAIDTAMNNLVALPPDNFQFIVCHFPKPPAPIPPLLTSPRVPPTQYALATGHVLKANMGTQVSRRPGHGS